MQSLADLSGHFEKSAQTSWSRCQGHSALVPLLISPRGRPPAQCEVNGQELLFDTMFSQMRLLMCSLQQLLQPLTFSSFAARRSPTPPPGPSCCGLEWGSICVVVAASQGEHITLPKRSDMLCMPHRMTQPLCRRTRVPSFWSCHMCCICCTHWIVFGPPNPIEYKTVKTPATRNSFVTFQVPLAVFISADTLALLPVTATTHILSLGQKQ